MEASVMEKAVKNFEKTSKIFIRYLGEHDPKKRTAMVKCAAERLYLPEERTWNLFTESEAVIKLMLREKKKNDYNFVKCQLDIARLLYYNFTRIAKGV